MVTNIINKIIEQREKHLQYKIQRYPRKNFIASDVVDCDRYMFYSVNNWQDRPTQDTSLQALFDAGNQEERNIIRELIDMGFNVVQQQTPFEIRNNSGDIICTGKIDLKIVDEGIAYPAEIKMMHDNLFNQIKTAEDLNKKPYQRKYLKQIQLYMYGNNIEEGFFIISNGRGQWKLLPVTLDYGLCESILQRLERTYTSLKSKTIPDKIEYNNQLCDKCPFIHLCMPSVQNEGSMIINNEELESSIDRREELKAFKDEYEELDETIKKTFVNIPEAFIGKYRIVGKMSSRFGVDLKALPEDIKTQYKTTTEYWTTKIIKL